MRCPACGSDKRISRDSRPTVNGELRRRRYECKACRYRYSTVEVIIGQMTSGPKRGLTEAQVFDMLVSVALPRASKIAMLRELMKREDAAIDTAKLRGWGNENNKP